MPNRMITPRRLIQQTKHCVQEALDVLVYNEDYRAAVDDLEHARMLIDEVLKKHLVPLARSYNRGQHSEDRDSKFGE